MTAMLQRKEFLSYRSPSESNVERRFVFEDGLLHATTNSVFITAYNPTFSQRKTRRGHGRLLNPQWKGKIAIDQEPNDIVAGFLILMGGKKAKNTCASFQRTLSCGAAVRCLWSF